MDTGAIPWIMLVAAFFAAAAAIATYFQARAITKSTTASNLVNCLDAYTKLMRDRTKAEEQKSEKLCKDYYRELFDLHWTEFQIWRGDMIPDRVMRAWLAVRRRNYEKDFLQFDTDNGQKITVKYSQIWDELKSQRYFEPSDPYLQFMDKAHEEVITDMKKLKKEFRKK